LSLHAPPSADPTLPPCLGAPLRPTALAGRARTVAPAAIAAARAASSGTQPKAEPAAPSTAVDPKTKAQSLIDALPGSNLLSKTAILSSGAGLGIFAISNEYYVLNEETVVAVALLSVWAGIIKFGGPMYSQWAEAQTARIKGILNQAREDHKAAVRARIDNVGQMESVVDVTRDLFAVSKETAQLEAQAYELEQKTAMAAEAKAVLDSWVRYEAQVKIKQQKELSEAVIAKVRKELENPKTLNNILQQSIADVERIVSSKSQ
jgi:F-type H+-transporting ATPase subunit b